MDRDYFSELEDFQDQLTKKGISKEQLDLSKFVGLSTKELQSIVNNPESFITKTGNDKFEDIKNLKKKGIPENFTIESYATIIDYINLLPNSDLNYPKDYIVITNYIFNIDLDQVENIMNHAIFEYNNYNGIKEYGRYSKWDDRLHEDKEFRPFAILMEECISTDTFHERHFQDILLDLYDKNF